MWIVNIHCTVRRKDLGGKKKMKWQEQESKRKSELQDLIYTIFTSDMTWKHELSSLKYAKKK